MQCQLSHGKNDVLNCRVFYNFFFLVHLLNIYKISGTVLGKKDISIPSIPTVENFELG